MWHENVARNLKFTQRNILIRHVNGPRPYRVSNNVKPFSTLVARGLIRYCTASGGYSGKDRAAFTTLTEDGRAVLGYVLGEFADGLAAAGFLEPNMVAIQVHGVKVSLTPDRYADRHEEPAETADQA